jgi:ketosteroid isomerase-like protein
MYPPAEPTVTGADAIGTYVDGFFSDTAFAVVFRPMDIQVSDDGTLGYTLNSADLSFTGPDGRLVTEHIRDFHVWRRQADGSWRLAIDIWNIEPASATTMD